MDSLLESTRRMHEEKERLTDTMTREWMHEKKNHKEKINSDHRLKLLRDRYLAASEKLADIYEDDDGMRDTEMQAVAGPNEFAEFYNRLKALKDTHRRCPDEIAVPLSMEFQEMNEAIDDPNRIEKDMVEFTDEEGYGRFLDMHSLFDKYLNLKGVKRMDYITYVSSFDRLYDLSKDTTKKSGAYRDYLLSLSDYLAKFLARTRPLLDLSVEMERCMEKFETGWTEKTFPGWTRDPMALHHGALAHSGAYLDLSPFNSPLELQRLGLDRLKSGLVALNMKCGGTLKERAERLFQTKGKSIKELDPNLFVSKNVSTTGGQQNREEQRQHDLAAMEARIYRLAELLTDERESTKENIERKQARTVGEEEEVEQEAVVLSDPEDDDDVPYNPKNLPLGWDGKPIPYWLYKLHGLNISYSCEICGNQVYKGPKSFQRHFTEWRHSHGMRCLGIPNTAHFANITKISEAIDLWQKLRDEKEKMRWKPELDEEFEDNMGNVVNRRTFEDLKRQGLL